ncbi:MAG: hypothetical protein ACKOWE_05945, partial [Micrococcales bacterium]
MLQNFVGPNLDFPNKFLPPGYADCRVIFVEGQWVVEGDWEKPSNPLSRDECPVCEFNAREFMYDSIIEASWKAHGGPKTWV